MAVNYTADPRVATGLFNTLTQIDSINLGSAAHSHLASLTRRFDVAPRESV